MYRSIRKVIAILAILCMLFCNTIMVFASQQKGYLLPNESNMIDRSDIFVALLNDSLLAGYEVENGLQMPLLINFRPVETSEDTLLYQGEWGAAKMAIFADKQTQRLQSVALILPRDYVLSGYHQGGLDYFASVGTLAGFFKNDHPLIKVLRADNRKSIEKIGNENRKHIVEKRIFERELWESYLN